MDYKAKARELYNYLEANTKISDSSKRLYNNQMDDKRKTYIEGAEFVLSTLAGDSRTKEEVLEPYFDNHDTDYYGFTWNRVGKADALKAMQQYADICVAKERDTSKVGLLAEIQSLQQQLSEAQKELEEYKKWEDKFVEEYKKWEDKFDGIARENFELREQLEEKDKEIEKWHTYNRVSIGQRTLVEHENQKLKEELAEKDKIAYDLSVEFTEAMNNIKKVKKEEMLEFAEWCMAHAACNTFRKDAQTLYEQFKKEHNG